MNPELVSATKTVQELQHQLHPPKRSMNSSEADVSKVHMTALSDHHTPISIQSEVTRVGSHELPDWLKDGIKQLKAEDNSREQLESARKELNDTTGGSPKKFKYFRKPIPQQTRDVPAGENPLLSYPAHLMPTDLVSLVEFFGKQSISSLGSIYAGTQNTPSSCFFCCAR